MTSENTSAPILRLRPLFILFGSLVILGLATFLFLVTGSHPERGWQTYLINFLLWSAIAQGGLLFPMVTHITKAGWSKPLDDIAGAFAAFFPISFGLFLLLFLGRTSLFPWLYQDLHGKEVWLNMPFLFSRDFIGLFILYGLGLAYVYHALRLKLNKTRGKGKIRALIQRNWTGSEHDLAICKNRMNVLSVLYILAYALVLTLIAFDLVMSMEPHWFSSLFGLYSFVKAFYLGLGALIILASIIRLHQGERSRLHSSHFHDLGKLLFAFCLLWADFFYAQLLVIWYGNISEETSYVITRTLFLPWKSLAWTVFIVGFILPFFVLLNRNIKTKPVIMIVICSVILIAIWLEHLLLLGPALSSQATSLPLGPADGLITLGFLGLMAFAVTFFLNLFPELVLKQDREMA